MLMKISAYEMAYYLRFVFKYSSKQPKIGEGETKPNWGNR